MTQEVSDTPKRRWGRVVLFVSLALNLLVAGVVAGALLGGPRDRDRDPALRDLGFGPFVSSLSRSDRAALRDGLRREAGALRENRAAMRAQFEELLTLLRAEPYDHAAVRAHVEGQHTRISERVTLGRQLLLERIEAMAPEERGAYADKLDEALRRGPGKRR